jgi:hypothetical protein
MVAPNARVDIDASTILEDGGTNDCATQEWYV